MKEMVEVKCPYCGKIVPKEAKRVRYNEKHGHRTYCSNECKNKDKVTAIDTYCVACGKQISIPRSAYTRSKSGFHYCSKSCANRINNGLKTGKRNANYVHGMGSYREQALLYYGSECTVCGYNIEDVLEVHHRDGNRKHNEMSNLDVLCPTHHKEYQLGLRKYPR